MLELTILGCGSSGGVPRVGQGWGACDPKNPKNRRRRCSLLIAKSAAHAPQSQKTQIVVDTSPDFRAQLLDAEVDRLDAIVYTHAHADHLHGIDDVRPLVILNERMIPAYMDEATAREAKRKFGYIFETPPGSFYPPLLIEKKFCPGQLACIDGPGGALEILPIPVRHGDIDALGLRFGDVAYMPDVNAISQASKALLTGLDLWILDALRYARHPSHLCVEESLALIEELKPRRAILTNLHVDLDYERLRSQLPLNVEPAYDGMTIMLRAFRALR